MLSKENLYDLYIIQNKSRKEMLKLLNVSINTFKKIMRKYGIKKSAKQAVKHRIKTCLEKYGAVSYSATAECKEKLSKIRKNKTLNEKIATYEKCKQTNLERYGVENVHQLKEVKEKIKQTNFKKYGGIGFASKKLNDKVKEKIIEKYGVDNISKSEEIKLKKIETKKKNNKYHSSSHEEKIYDLLLKKFSNVKRQHHTKKYPFDCDFYVPKLDLYIEYQGYFSHGKINENNILGPYDESNELHKKILNEWKKRLQNGHKHYSEAIYTWTVRDPKKREIAKKNNLNWLEFFNLKQFMKWYNTI